MKKILIILCSVILLTGCGNNTNESSGKEKLTAEMKYISMQLEDLLHNLNNISLENYEIVSEIVNMSEESSSQGGSSQGQNSQASSSQSQSSGQSSSGGGQSGRKIRARTIIRTS